MQLSELHVLFRAVRQQNPLDMKIIKEVHIWRVKSKQLKD